MNRKLRTRLALYTSAAMAVALPGAESAHAQQAPAATPSATSDSRQLDEILVTATRREQNLQKVPVAVTAITADQLKKLGVATLADLQFSVPNFVFGGEASNRRPDIALRGIDSATRVPGFEGSIGFFVDGVYQPFPDQWNNPILDVERLEVLYGPQDALFGKNTVAGAVSITTKKPTSNFGANLTAEYGNYNYYTARGDVNIPIITDKLYARFSGFFARRDGYITNVYNGQKYNGRDEQGGRAQLKYTPTSNFEINLSADVYGESVAEVQGQTIGGAYSTGNPRTVNLNTTPQTTRSLYDVAMTMQYAFDNGAKLTSITGWSKTRAHYHTDEDGNPVDQWVTDILDRTNNFSQEFRFSSPIGKTIDYIVGLYYLNTYWAQPGSLQTLPGDPNNATGGLGVLNSDGTLSYSDAYAKRVTSTSYAAYADLNYHFDSQWSVSLGGRVTHDDKYLSYPGQLTFGAGFLNLCKLGASFGAGCLIPGGAYPVEPAYQDSLGSSALTGSASLNFQANKDTLLYAKISNGYKGGGWNTDLTHSSPPAKFNPEHVINYEVGFKTELLDRHLRFNADAFYQDYKNKQETVFVNITQGFVISNAASATIKGFEASLSAVLGDLSFNGGIGYVDPTYNNFQCTATVNCKGQQLVFATKVTANGSVEFQHQIADLGKFAIQAQVTFRDKMYLAVPNDPTSTIPGYTLINARASFTLQDGKTEIYVFGKNLANKTYLVSQFAGSPSYPGYGETSDVLYGQPRFYGIGVTRHF